MDAGIRDMLFLKETLQKGIRDIFEAQRLIARKKIYQTGHERVREKRDGQSMKSRSGRLMEALDNPNYLLSADSARGLHVDLNYPIQIRFLDMKRFGNWQIYNRQIWGILFKETFIEMRYGLSDWLQKFTHDTLEESLKPLNNS